jgi:hypothetical protein
MTQVISTQTKTFKFTDEFSPSTSSHYLTTVTVKELKYEDGNHYWDIGYAHKFIPGTIDLPVVIINSLEKKLHPFYKISQVQDFMDYEGDILFKNPMTTIMVEYLLMDYEELALVSGVTTAQRYKQSIMWSLSYFWD